MLSSRCIKSFLELYLRGNLLDIVLSNYAKARNDTNQPNGDWATPLEYVFRTFTDLDELYDLGHCWPTELSFIRSSNYKKRRVGKPR
jgi:hypothetical protein